MLINIAKRNLSLTAKLSNRSIKFRHGIQLNQQGTASSQPSQVISPSNPQPTGQGSSEAIWDFQLPARWKRAPISEEECAVINNGGPL